MPDDYPCREHAESIAELRVQYENIKADTEAILKKLSNNGLVQIVHDHSKWIESQNEKRMRWEKIKTTVLGGIILWIIVGESGLLERLIAKITGAQ